MKIKTTKELINLLEQYEDDTPVVIRQSHGDGYYSDHHLQFHNLYPSGTIAFVIGDQVDDFAGEVFSEVHEGILNK